MRNSVKKAAVTALVCVTAAGMMAGCGNKKLDGTKIAVTVNKQEIPFGVVSLAARMQQAQAEAMYKMYLGGGSDMSIWSTKLDDDSDETYGENAVTTSVETVEKMCLEKEHASEYDVEITDDEQKALEEAAKNFMAANSDETIAELAVDEDMVKTFLELETYDVKMKAMQVQRSAEMIFPMMISRRIKRIFRSSMTRLKRIRLQISILLEMRSPRI